MQIVQDKNATKPNKNLKTAKVLTDADHKFLERNEEMVSRGQIDAALALYAIKTHAKKPWKHLGFKSFAAYAAARFGYKENHSYRMCRFGEFLTQIMTENLELKENKLPQPPTEGFYREISRLGDYDAEVSVLKDLAVAGKPLLASEAKVLVDALLAKRPVEVGKVKKDQDENDSSAPNPQLKYCQRLVAKLREKVSDFPQSQKIADLLAELEKALAEKA